MMLQRSDRSTSRWLVGVGLLVVGMVFGAVLHSLWIADRLPDSATDTEAASNDTGEVETEGTLSLPLDVQKTSGTEVVQATIRAVPEFLQLTGIVAPDHTRVAHIRPLARGVVKEVHVRPGDRVEGGAELLTYDNIELGAALGDYASTLAEVQSARSTVEVTRTILARSEEMLKVGAVAQTTHDLRAAEHRDAQARLQSLLASVEKLEMQLQRFGMSDNELEALREGDRRKVEPSASRDVLRAPFSGVVTGFQAAEGELIRPDDEVFSIADLSTVWVLANVYEKDLAVIRVGQRVEVRTGSYPDHVFPGMVDYISDVIDPQTRTAKVRCLVKNPQTRLKLEMFATVSVRTDTDSRTIVVPRQALQEIDGSTILFVRKSETEFEKRPVVTGTHSGDWVSISHGLQEGESVVSQGSFALKSALLRERFGGEEEGH